MKYFQNKEFACKCGCGYGLKDSDVAPLLKKEMDAIREDLGKPIIINSGCRCAAYNAKVGGVKHSQHVLGNAADFQVVGMSPNEVQEYLLKRYKGYGIGRYNTFTHLDVRPGPHRWDFRK